MKRKILIFIGMLIIMLTFNAAAQDTIYGKFEYMRYNEILSNMTDQTGQAFFMSEDLEVPAFGLESSTLAILIPLAEEERTTFLKAIEKYYEWNQQAIDQEVELEKEIDQITTRIIFSQTGDNYVDNSATVQFYFFSQNKENHQFVLRFSELEARSNQFISLDFDNAYFSSEQVKKLESLFTDQGLEEGREVIKEKEKTKDQFD